MACPLLKLPAELRNRIYEFVAAEDHPIRIARPPRDKNDRCPKMGDSDAMKAKSAVNSNNPSRLDEVTRLGSYAGLTRVCRQIREEFMPLQQRHARVVLSACDLEAFVTTFLDPNNVMEELQIASVCEDCECLSVDFIEVLQAKANWPAHFVFSVIDGSNANGTPSDRMQQLSDILQSISRILTRDMHLVDNVRVNLNDKKVVMMLNLENARPDTAVLLWDINEIMYPEWEADVVFRRRRYRH